MKTNACSPRILMLVLWSTGRNQLLMRKHFTLLFLLGMLCLPAKAVLIDATNFPDATLRAYVAANFDVSPTDGDLSSFEAIAATTVNIQNDLTLTDLTGVEHLLGLQDLYVNGCTNLVGTPDLSQAPNLDRARLYNTGISGITFSATANFYASMRQLYAYNCLSYSGIVDISNMPVLERLRAYTSNLDGLTTNATANYYTALSELRVQSNANFTGTIDLSNMPIMRLFQAHNCNVTGLAFNATPSYYTNFQQLQVNGNDGLGGTLDISEMPTLVFVYGYSCNFTAFITNATANYYGALRRLQMQSNVGLASAVDISNMPVLERCYFQTTIIPTITTNATANYYSAMDRLYLQDGALTGAVDISGMSTLQRGYAYNNDISTFTTNTGAGYYTSMQYLYLYNNLNLNAVDFSNMATLSRMRANDCGLTSATMSTSANFYPALEWLYLYDNAGLTGTLDISGMPVVQRVQADDCDFTTFAGSGTANYYTAMDRIYLFNCASMTGTINLSNMPTLRDFRAYNCDLMTLTFNAAPSYYTALESFRVYNNNSLAGALNFSTVPTLIRVQAYSCDFTSFASSGTANFYPNLTHLQFGDNLNLTGAIDITGMPAVQYVQFQNCNMSSFVSNATGGYYTAMNQLYLTNNASITSSVNISNMSTIRRFYGYGCDLADLTLGSHPSMQYLYYQNNASITGIHNYSSMAALIRVRAYNCSLDSIVTGGIGAHPSTTEMRFENNNLADVSTLVPNASLSLTDIRVNGNQLDCDDFDDIKAMDINMGGDGQTPWNGTNVYASSRFNSQQGGVTLITCAEPALWTGVNSTNWNDAGNWIGVFPACSVDAIIPDVSAASGNFPLINTGATGAVRDIRLLAGANLDVTTGFELQVCGNWNNDGQADVGDGLISYIGTSEQKLNGSTNFGGFTLDNANDANLETGTFEITGVMTLTDGTLTTGDALTFISDINGTGSLAELGATGDIAGEIVMQRYIPAGATNWRLLSIPVQGATLDDWSGDFITSGYIGSDFPNFGFTSIYYYDQLIAGGVMDDGYVAASNSTSTISSCEGVWVWCGDSNGGTAPFTVDARGAPHKGPQSRTPGYNNNGAPDDDGWNMFGNPYPSDIDWSNITHSGIENQYWVYDPQSGNTASWDEGTSTGTLGANGSIASSQAYWIHATGAASFSMDETAKTTGAAPIFSTQNPMNIPMMRLKVSSAINTYYDETILRFHAHGDDNAEQFDALKVFASHYDAPNLTSLSADGKDMCINTYNELTQAVSIPLRVKVAHSGTYELSVTEFSDYFENQCLTLEDLETGILTPLDSNTMVSFTIMDTATMPRFVLHIDHPFQTTLTALTCNGVGDGELTAQGAGAGPWDYIWTDAVGTIIQQNNNVSGGDVLTGLDAGTYNLTIATSAVCGGASASFVITEPLEVVAGFGAPDTVNLATTGNVDFLNLSSGAQDYTWDFGDGSPVSTALAPSHVYQTTGDFTVMLEAVSGACPDTIYGDITVIDNDVSIFETTFVGPESYVNNNGEVVVAFDWEMARDVQVNIYNSIGQQLMPTQRLNVQSGSSYFRPNVDGAQVLLIEVVDLENEEVYVFKLLK
jgi:hypothetical protein